MSMMYLEAYGRAKELLVSNTSTQQRDSGGGKQFCGDSLEIRGGLTGIKYHVCAAGAIAHLNPDQVFCVYAKGSRRDSLGPAHVALPDPDAVLALALYVQHDEFHFLTHAAPHVPWMINAAADALQARARAGAPSVARWLDDGGRWL